MKNNLEKNLSLNDLKKIEKLELKYLNKYYHFLKFAEDEMFEGFKTKEDIKDDWLGLYGTNEGKGISDFSVGAERIIYSLLNGKGIGQPNSSPVGSDLFFEVEDAYIHIDLKTVQEENIGDFTTSIFVGKNQNSYKGEIVLSNNEKRIYIPSLPYFYTKSNGKTKLCLTFFISILYNRETLEILVIAIQCMPNGFLESHYGSRVLKAGKNLDKARFNIKNVNKFELIENQPSRIKVVYFNDAMSSKLKDKLKIFDEFYYKENNL
ncbi:hypothetical protein RNN91_04420 [Mycoplasmopsis felis]|uniref:hypothetical protein n=1 Tax=Mycoplasmopsis felis TaxID=33923 RepID=UPI002AF6B41D|nr:hypothetical protein [Mycoplasmopsis felis]WQQ01501.1 hypothetical protein RRG54_02835 [Mycoplasmopsis felis]